ncbi:calcium-binding protein [Rhizobium alvei]|uniref:Calcium-binding protein n=1 Tax=Rhizobium alvei TaxID=1132659 RepID=A0ABT8YIE0_9HYPH|nr:calcium-binding protein [Rhizobium alvei]MDO6963432.1 calcium-binding protein [Rhizobium alvei]
MTTSINIQVEDGDGVDLSWMFPGSLAIKPQGTSRSGGGIEATVEYIAGGTTYLLRAEGVNFSSPAYGLDIKGIASSLALYRLDDSNVETKLVDITFALDNVIHDTYGGIPINSLLSLTSNSLVNLLSAHVDIEFNIYGNSGNDTLQGSGYFDFIDGKEGRDILTGGLAGDTFFFGYFGKEDRDRVTDFRHGVDKIAIDGNIMAGILPANLKRTFHDITEGGMRSEDANDRLLYDGNTGKLYYDPDGNASNGARAELVAILDNHAHLTISDFQVFL